MSGFNQIKYQNDYNKKKYERMTILFPKGKKERVKERATDLNKSVSCYLNDLIDDDLRHGQDFFSINNRRYLGNKYKLLDFIKDTITHEKVNFDTFTDIFAGSGVVASAFSDKKLITNDILYSNYLCHVAWFGNEKFSSKKIDKLIKFFNTCIVIDDNYMSENFADTYFSREVCLKIGFIREEIQKLFVAGEINKREHALLVTSLLYAMDKIAKTCGHYDAYRKGGNFEGSLYLKIPDASNQNNGNQCFNEDALSLGQRINHDLVYMDPPYNSRQYSDSYHLLENVARWEKPPVYGVALKMDRSNLKSDYCTKKAVPAFRNLISSIKANYILMSYNNMGLKGDDRSNARISDKDILEILSTRGTVKVFSKDYKPFTAGKSDIVNNQERLFLCKITN